MKKRNAAVISLIGALIAGGGLSSQAAAAEDHLFEVDVTTSGFGLTNTDVARGGAPSSEGLTRVRYEAPSGDLYELVEVQRPIGSAFEARSAEDFPSAVQPTSTAGVGPTETSGAAAVSEVPSDAEWLTTLRYAVSSNAAKFYIPDAIGNVSATGAGQVEVNMLSAGGAVAEITSLSPGSEYNVDLAFTRSTSEDDVDVTQTLSISTPSDKSISIAAAQNFMAYQHVTFIPDFEVDGAVCNGGDSSYRFRGDNRGWSTPANGTRGVSGSWRTNFTAEIDYANDYIGYNLSVNASDTYRNGQLVHSATADSNNIYLQDSYISGAYGQTRMIHAAANPHCEFFNVNYGGIIQYEQIVRWYGNGIIEVEGWRRPVPRHEAFAGFNGRFTTGAVFDWKNTYRGSNQGFHCLTGAPGLLCPIATINNSVGI